MCYEHKLEENIHKAELKLTHLEYAQFEISHLVHNTALDNFLGILNDEIIKPGSEKEIKTTGRYKFSWWGLSVEKQERDNYSSEMKKLIKGTRGTSAMLDTGPFCKTSRYGNFRIKLPVWELFEHYKTSLGGEKAECQKRILWTTAYYENEVMHTILVHPKDEKFEKEFGHLQTMEKYIAVNEGSYPVVKEINDKWIWCPESTSIIHPDTTGDKKEFKSWDHLTFAFLIPDGCEGIGISKENLMKDLSFQRIGETNLSPDEGYKTVYQAVVALLEKAPQKLNKMTLRLLLKQISESIEEKLSEKEIKKEDIKQIEMKFKNIILENFKNEMEDFEEVVLKMDELKKRKKRESKAKDGKQPSKSKKRTSGENEPKKDGKKSRRRRGKGTKEIAAENEQKGKSKKSSKVEESIAELAVENETKRDEKKTKNKTDELMVENLQNQNPKESDEKSNNQEYCDR